jgi:HD-GYP domain-containing protein (c-di-GMP phosphodiesterase class II)
LSKFDHLTHACNIPLYHHERWDGLGYPYGLKGEEIPLDARIFSIVDVWDSMIHDRVYRLAVPVEEVVFHLRQESGKSFQPELVEHFLELVRTGVIK